MIPQIATALDAGVIVSSAKPTTVLITHTHADHCFRVTHLTSRQKVPDFYCPEPSVPLLAGFVLAGVNLSGHNVTGEYEYESNFVSHGVNAGDMFFLKKYRDIQVRVLEMDHSIPCVGYGFSRSKKKLKREYAGIKGAEIARMRKEGVDVMEEQETKMFVFCGDTTTRAFQISPELLLYPIIIIECSFYRKEERDKAESSRHVHWDDLKPIVLRHPQTRFILIHLSMRYQRKEIIEFFEAENVHNIELMLQDENDDFGSTFGRQYKK